MKFPVTSADSDRMLLRMEDYARLRGLVGGVVFSDELDRAIVIPDDRIPPDVITMNTCIVYADDVTGASREVELVYPGEADAAAGRISVLAPVGMALIGLAVGQSIDWEFPDGKVHRLHVLRVSRRKASRIRQTDEAGCHAE